MKVKEIYVVTGEAPAYRYQVGDEKSLGGPLTSIVESIEEGGIEEGEETSWLVRWHAGAGSRFFRPEVKRVDYEER